MKIIVLDSMFVYPPPSKSAEVVTLSSRGDRDRR